MHTVTMAVKGSHLKKYLKLLSVLQEVQMKQRMLKAPRVSHLVKHMEKLCLFRETSAFTIWSVVI